MKCAMKHQRAYARSDDTRGKLWCPDCQIMLSHSESKNVELRLMRKAAGVSTSDEQLNLEKEIKS